MADTHPVRTTCPYCGTGCGLLVTPDGQGGIAHLQGDPLHPANHGRLCGKGMALGESLAMDGRLTQPLLHGQAVPWPQALNAVAHGFRATLERHGPDAVAFYVSGQLLTEDYYVANKLMKGFIGSANIDSNSRLCMAAAVVGHKRALGADLVPCNYEDLELADLVILVGSNTAWCHPVLFQRILAARQARPGKKLVVIDPRRTSTAQEADLHLAIQGGGDLLLWLGLLTWLQQQGHFDRSFLRAGVEMDAHALELAQAYAPDAATVAAQTGLDPQEVTAFYQLFARTPRTVTLFSQGINQSMQGSDQVNAIFNCHLASGRMGKPGCGPFSITGQPNAMGGREVGALANQLANHLALDNPHHRQLLQHFWQSPRMADKPGLMAVDLFRAVEQGRVKALWIMGTNPLVSMPDTAQVRRALSRCPLLVVSEVVRHTDTADLAHILLPARAWGEKDGTVTNSERRISRQRRFLAGPALAWPDWRILCEVAKRMGFQQGFDFAGSGDIFREHAALSDWHNQGSRAFDIGPLARLSDAEYNALPPRQWPMGVHGEKRVGSHFYTANGKARLLAVSPAKNTHAVTADHPLRLNTGRVRDHWHTLTRTGASPRLSRHSSEPQVEIHPRDAQALAVTDGQLCRVNSLLGDMVARAVVSEGQRPGSLFIAMHWNRQFAVDGVVNTLVAGQVDPWSGQPRLKHTAATLTPLASLWRGFLLSRHARPALPDSFWWCRQAVEDGVWLFTLEGRQPLNQWQRETAPWLTPATADQPLEWIDFADPRHHRLRRATLTAGRLHACLYLDGVPRLADPLALLELFRLPILAPAQRAAILAGGATAQPRSRTICACAGVTENAIQQAIAQGTPATVEAIAAHLKAGAQCGSCRQEVGKIVARMAA